jgi:hypothetical protein
MAKSASKPEGLLAALPTELSHSLFAKARLLSLAADQTLFVAGDNPCSPLCLGLEIDVANRWVAPAPATSTSGTLHNRDRA